MRIIAGSCKGRRFDAPKGPTTRPTSDFVRETAFNLIGPVDGAAVLDLFAGSGGLGLEALSRGAERCVFVDSDRAACRTIGANLEKLRSAGALVLCQDAFPSALRGGRRRSTTWSSPTRRTTFPATTTSRHLGRILAPDGLLVVETPAAVRPVPGLSIRTSRKYGSARLTLFER